LSWTCSITTHGSLFGHTLLQSSFSMGSKTTAPTGG
jgi:hypothetical protein